MPWGRNAVGGGVSGGARGAQIPGQDPTSNADDLLKQLQALRDAGVLPQAPVQQPPPQMDPQEAGRLGSISNLSAQLGTTHPTTWAQIHGVQPRQIGNGNPLGFMTTPAVQGLANQQQLTQFGNTQATAQNDARNKGLDMVSNIVAAQRQGALQQGLLTQQGQQAQTLAGIQGKNQANVANIRGKWMYDAARQRGINKPLGPVEQGRLSMLDSLDRDLANVEQLRQRHDIGSLLKYAGGLGFFDRAQLKLTGKSDDEINDLASDAQSYNSSLQNLKMGHRALMPGRTLQSTEGALWAKQRVPGMDPAETENGFDMKMKMYRDDVAGARGHVHNIGRVNDGTGETQDDNSAGLGNPAYSGNPPVGRQSNGDTGSDPFTRTDPATGEQRIWNGRGWVAP